MKKNVMPKAPRVPNACRQYDEGLGCGICGGRPCIGHTVKVKVRRRGEVRDITIAQYRETVYKYDLDGNQVLDHYEYCPIIKELMKCIQTVPSATVECENTSSPVRPSDVLVA